MLRSARPAPAARPGRRVAAVLAVLLVPTVLGGGSGPVAAQVVPPAPPPAAAAAPDVPTGFSDTLVWRVPFVTDMAALPDGRLLLASQRGRLHVVTAAGRLLDAPALDLSARACTNSERGLLGVSAHPRFASTRWVYLTWTRRTGTGCDGVAAVNRVSRFTLGGDGRVVPGSEVVVADHIPSPAGNHNAGDSLFGADGLLYLSTGDGGCQLTDPTRCGPLNANARRLDVPLGKVLRVRDDGTVPATNPWASAPGARRCVAPAGPQPGTGPCRETFATGLRNPFRMAVRPGTSTVLVNDVGQGDWEEVDRLAAGADYGWNACEGRHRTGTSAPCTAGTVPPVHEYAHSSGCTSVTGAAFVPAGAWPAAYDGSYLFADFACGKLFRRTPSGAVSVFAEGLASPVSLLFGPAPGGGRALYWSSYTDGVHRVTATSGNTAPVADLTARPDPEDPMVVVLDGTRSFDPDGGDAVASYRWTFGDGTGATTTTPTVRHRYATTAARTASLVVVDGRGARSPADAVRVVPGDLLPEITLTGAGRTYGVGEPVVLTATAVDPEDGVLPASALTWLVELHHDSHRHPRLGPVTGGSVRTAYPAPEDVAAAATSWLDVTVSATDSAGFTRTVHRRVLPATVPVTLAARPSGATVRVNGTAVTTPRTLTAWRGWTLALQAPDQAVDGTPLRCTGWSDGGACSHDVVTPDVPLTLTAAFAPR